MMPEKPRQWWVAGLLSFVVPGLGQLYNGQAGKGLICYGLIWLIYPASLLIMMGAAFPPFNVVAALLLLLSAFAWIVMDAIRVARGRGDGYQLRAYDRWYVYLLLIVGSTFVVKPALSMLIKGSLVQAYKIPSGGMTPALLVGDHILVEKRTARYGSVNRGDIVVFPYPHDESRDFIKRVIGLPGEVVEVRGRQVYINGKPIPEPYLGNSDAARLINPPSPRESFGPVTVPEGKLFVLGDNRDQSQDSRFWGFLDVHKVEGRTRTIYFSWDRDARRVRWERIGQPIR